jgi:hypothetical protein
VSRPNYEEKYKTLPVECLTHSTPLQHYCNAPSRCVSYLQISDSEMWLTTKYGTNIITESNLTLIRCSLVDVCECCVLMNMKTGSLVQILGERHKRQ